MAGWRCYIWLHLQPLHISGDQLRITEDEFSHLCPCVPALTFLPFSTLAMSDELAQEDEDAEDYDLEAIEARTRARDDDDDDATLTDRRPLGTVGEDAVVFEIGDQDMSDDEDGKPIVKKTQVGQHHEDDHHGDDNERQGLMGNGNVPKDHVD